jgi:glycosyltransferase involved in cell wall biosynthesis
MEDINQGTVGCTHKIAVLMSVYGRDVPEALDAAIASIVCQEGLAANDVHIYLGVDGFIGPDLDEIVRKWSMSIYRLVRFERNRGLAHVLNDLILSLGDEQFVFRMDADDIALPRRFISQIRYLHANPNVDICGTAIIEMQPSVAVSAHRIVRYPLTHSAALRTIRWRSPFAHPTVCFRRRALDLLGSYPLNSSNEDIAMWFKALAAGLCFGNLDEPYLKFRISDGFWGRRGIAKAVGELQCYLRGFKAINVPLIYYALPLARFAMRLSPAWFKRLMYMSNLRR